jgi:hypothetical protein
LGSHDISNNGTFVKWPEFLLVGFLSSNRTSEVISGSIKRSVSSRGIVKGTD